MAKKTNRTGATVKADQSVVCEMSVLGTHGHCEGVVVDGDEDIGIIMDILAHWPRTKLAWIGVAVSALLGMSDAERDQIAVRQATMAELEWRNPLKAHPDRNKHTRTITVRDAA